METFQTLHKRPKVEKLDLSRRIYPDLHLGYDESHRIVIIKRGDVDVQAKIDAAAAGVPSLAELCAAVPGDTPAAQLQNAIDNGILPATPEGDHVNDFTQVPETVQDLDAFSKSTKAALGDYKNFQELVKSLVDQAIKENQAPAEDKKEATE